MVIAYGTNGYATCGTNVCSTHNAYYSLSISETQGMLFGNDDLSVEINTFIFSCVQKYIKDIRRFAWTNKSTCITLLTIVDIMYFYMYVYSFLGRAEGYWLIDVSKVDEIYMCYSVQIVLTYARSPWIN